jgi:ABC-type thiamine transport system ATPase subunit
MDYYEAVIHRFGGEGLLNSARAEMDRPFSIVAQTQDYFVLTDGKKNVKFGRKNGRVLERFDLVTRKELSRKAVG